MWFSWDFSWVGKMGWEFCAKGISRSVPGNRELLQKYSPHLTANASRALASEQDQLLLPIHTLQYLDLSGPPGNVTSYCCLLKVTAFNLCYPVPKWQWHFTAYLHTKWSRFYPAVAVVALPFLFYFNYLVPCFLAAACAAGIRDPWQLLGLWAWHLLEIKSTHCFLLCFLTDDSAQLQKNGCKIWDFG